ncbi:MAG: alpha-amylase family glycosyl hydrolase [Sideroxyarcus sp.]
METRLSEIDFQALCGRKFFPSPEAWEDHVFYFLLLDRFSDGKENGFRSNDGKVVTTGSTAPFQPADNGNAVTGEAPAAEWREAGGKWVGGNLKGLTGKIGYLKRLGVTAIWVSPVFKQVAFQPTYHGYGIQNFLDVDPNFGTREDLKKMVDVAHEHGIHVVMDIILNHSGNVFSYTPDRHWTHDNYGNYFMDPRWDGKPYSVKGFNAENGEPTIPFSQRPAASLNDAIWPVEFQNPAFYTQRGHINNWDHDPEYKEGDFCDLKDIHHGFGETDHYQASEGLKALCQAYKFWIAYADIDGFRIDTVKHMDPGATRYFTSVIHEFTQDIGKENFYLIGEITGDRKFAYNLLELTGLDAALGIGDIQNKLEYLVKGKCNPAEYFDLFRNSALVHKDSHLWFRNKVVVTFDDHDQIRKGDRKARFCADSEDNRKQILNVMALNAASLGVPCIYYGSEQAFDGEGTNDRYIREAMFGGKFGAFRSAARHCFNEDSYLYRELAEILAIRKKEIVLRRGRQFLREISGDGENFGLPRVLGDKMLSVVAWSRIFDDREMLLALNTDSYNARGAWVTIDNDLHDEDSPLKCIYSTEKPQVGQELKAAKKNGKAVFLTVPPAGFVIFG